MGILVWRRALSVRGVMERNRGGEMVDLRVQVDFGY